MKFNSSFLVRLFDNQNDIDTNPSDTLRNLNSNEQIPIEERIEKTFKVLKTYFLYNNQEDKYITILVSIFTYMILLILNNLYDSGDITCLKIKNEKGMYYEATNEIVKFCHNKYNYEISERDNLLSITFYQIVICLLNISINLADNKQKNYYFIMINHFNLYNVMVKVLLKLTFMVSYFLCFIFTFVYSNIRNELFLKENIILVLLIELISILCVIRLFYFFIKSMACIFIFPIFVTVIPLAIFEDLMNIKLNKIIKTEIKKEKNVDNVKKNNIQNENSNQNFTNEKSFQIFFSKNQDSIEKEKLDNNDKIEKLLNNEELEPKIFNQNVVSSLRNSNVKNDCELIENTDELNRKSILQITCAICLNDIEENNIISTLPCNSKHCYHTECLQLWFEKNTSCPICRYDFSKEINEILGIEEEQIENDEINE